MGCEQKRLRRRELNPGLPRDRRKYQPLYYSGSVKDEKAREEPCYGGLQLMHKGVSKANGSKPVEDEMPGE